MQIFNTSIKGTDYFQIYLTKEELENKQIQEKIHKIKDSNAKVAVFVSGKREQVGKHKNPSLIILYEKYDWRFIFYGL